MSPPSKNTLVSNASRVSEQFDALERQEIVPPKYLYTRNAVSVYSMGYDFKNAPAALRSAFVSVAQNLLEDARKAGFRGEVARNMSVRLLEAVMRAGRVKQPLSTISLNGTQEKELKLLPAPQQD